MVLVLQVVPEDQMVLDPRPVQQVQVDQQVLKVLVVLFDLEPQVVPRTLVVLWVPCFQDFQANQSLQMTLEIPFRRENQWVLLLRDFPRDLGTLGVPSHQGIQAVHEVLLILAVQKLQVYQ